MSDALKSSSQYVLRTCVGSNAKRVPSVVCAALKLVTETASLIVRTVRGASVRREVKSPLNAPSSDWFSRCSGS